MVGDGEGELGKRASAAALKSRRSRSAVSGRAPCNGAMKVGPLVVAQGGIVSLALRVSLHSFLSAERAERSPLEWPESREEAAGRAAEESVAPTRLQQAGGQAGSWSCFCGQTRGRLAGTRERKLLRREWATRRQSTVAELAAGCTCSTRVRDLTCLDKRALLEADSVRARHRTRWKTGGEQRDSRCRLGTKKGWRRGPRENVLSSSPLTERRKRHLCSLRLPPRAGGRPCQLCACIDFVSADALRASASSSLDVEEACYCTYMRLKTSRR